MYSKNNNLSLSVMNRQILNAKKSWVCIEIMHCQFVVSHSECRLGFKVLSLNAYYPNFKKSQTLKLPFGYVLNFWLWIVPIHK